MSDSDSLGPTPSSSDPISDVDFDQLEDLMRVSAIVLLLSTMNL